jgi:glycine/D-amino acid oxidase-like deaminating enzyme
MLVTHGIPLGCLLPLTGITSPYRHHLLLPAFLSGVYVFLPVHTVNCVETLKVCGPESFTPDHKPLVGPDPALRGLWNMCGFNSMGMMLGGGVGTVPPPSLAT